MGSDGRDSVRVTTLQAALTMEDWDDNYEESDNYEGYEDKPCSICPVPGLAPVLEIKGLENGSEKTFKISQFKGRYLVVVFYHGKQCAGLVEEFSNIKSQLASNGADVVCVSSDSSDSQAAWIKADKCNGGLGGSLSIPLWSDPAGELAVNFDLYNEEGKHCVDGVVIIDDAGITRHVMTTSLDSKELATTVFSLVPVLKKQKVDKRDLQTGSLAMSSPQESSAFKVKIDVKELEKDWDVTEDPELQKVLNVAKLLGRTNIPTAKTIKKVPMFNLLPNQIRKLSNPQAPVKSVMASLQRNLAGFGDSGDIPANQRIQLENIMKKVMGVAYMPEELNGTFTSLRNLKTRELSKLLDSDVFHLTYDNWMATPGAKQWSEGQGVFINNYSNFVLWVNEEDQLRLVSVSKGQDLKYVLLRLQKAVARIEEALKMILSIKSCKQRGFTTSDGNFVHSRREVYGTGLEVVVTMDLVGLAKAGFEEIEKAKREFGLKIEKCAKGVATFSVVKNQGPDDSEEDIVSNTVTAVDNLARLDFQFQSKLGVKLTL